MRPSKNLVLMTALAEEMRHRRKELFLTQEALALAVDLDRPYVTLIEAARKQPTVSVFWRLAQGLQLSAGELADRVDERLRRSR